MRFYILEQKYLELVEDGRLLEALFCLRAEITPLRKFVARVHELAGYDFQSFIRALQLRL